MENRISGKAYVLGDNIDTDQIIPAEHLVYSLSDPEESKKYGQYAMAGTPNSGAGLPNGGIPFVKSIENTSEFNLIIGGANFGCGSSREHAVWVFEVNAINVVVAESFARIFRQNMFNCGMLALELPKNDIDTLFKMQADQIEIDLDTNSLIAKGKEEVRFSFVLNAFDKDLVRAGGWLAFADKTY